MNPADARAYVERPWGGAEALKADYWAEEFARRGSAATVEASDALWHHMRQLHPDWPSDEERREDLAHHVALKRAIDRAAGAFVSISRR